VRGVVAVAGNKGGIGKTTLAVNLAVLLRRLRPEVPVLLVGLDDQDGIDRMFGDVESTSALDIAAVLAGAPLASALRLGRYGVHYVPTSPRVATLKREIGTRTLATRLEALAWPGIVLVDTKADLEELTQNALWASDRVLLPVADHTSLREVAKVHRLLESWGRSREETRIVLSLVDLRIKYANAEHGDVLALLLAEIRSAGLPLFETFVSRSPRIEALQTNLGGRPLPVCEQAPQSLVHEQLTHLTEELLRELESVGAAKASGAGSRTARIERRGAPRSPAGASLLAFTERDDVPRALALRDVSITGLGTVGPLATAVGERLHLALADAEGRPALCWARVVRDVPDGGLCLEAPVPPPVRDSLAALGVGAQRTVGAGNAA